MAAKRRRAARLQRHRIAASGERMNTLVPKRWQPLVIGALLVGIGVLVLINSEVPEGESGGVVEMLIPIAIMLLATFLLWRFVVGPRVVATGVAAAAGTTALVLGIFALLTSSRSGPGWSTRSLPQRSRWGRPPHRTRRAGPRSSSDGLGSSSRSRS